MYDFQTVFWSLQYQADTDFTCFGEALSDLNWTGIPNLTVQDTSTVLRLNHSPPGFSQKIFLAPPLPPKENVHQSSTMSNFWNTKNQQIQYYVCKALC